MNRPRPAVKGATSRYEPVADGSHQQLWPSNPADCCFCLSQILYLRVAYWLQPILKYSQMPTTPRLPSGVLRELRRIGDGIKTARLRRGMSQEELATRTNVTFHTIRAIEMGRPSTAIGHYLNALWVLGLIHTISSVADPALDKEGLILESAERRRRSGGGRRGRGGAGPGMSNDF